MCAARQRISASESTVLQMYGSRLMAVRTANSSAARARLECARRVFRLRRVASRCARGPQRRGSLNAEAQCRGRGARSVPLERQPSGRDASRALRVPPALARASAASRAQSLRRPTPRRRRNAGRSLVAAGCTSQRVPLRLLYYENSARRRRRPPAQLRCPPLQHRRPRLELEREFAARVFTSRTLPCALPYRTVWSAPTRPVLTSHLISHLISSHYALFSWSRSLCRVNCVQYTSFRQVQSTQLL